MTSPYIGEIRMFAGNFAPEGWLFCQGQLLQIADYDVLFNLIGTTYGGDGQETFALPDLRSRMPIDTGSGFALGQQGGAESVTVTTAQLPGHTHAPVANTAATGPSPNGQYWASFASPMYSSQGPPPDPMAATALSKAGGGAAHENMSPYLVINFILATVGIYPSPT